jgi:cell wall-associated NlpC family hydrolase
MPTRPSSGGLAVRVAVALLLLISLAGVAISIDAHSATASGSASTTTSGSHATTADGSHAAIEDASSTGADIVDYAAKEKGIAYCDGGGGINGPSVGGSGSTCAKGVVGFDCMSLAQYAVYQATGFAIDTENAQGYTENIYGGTDYKNNGTMGSYVAPGTSGTVASDEAALSPGDVVLFGGFSTYSYAHSGIWAGNDQIWDASGSQVQIVSFENLMSTYNNAYQGGMDYNALSQKTPPSFPISTSSLPVATVGKKYAGAQLQASGGTAPYRWKVSGLPKGLKASAKTGLIKGTVSSSKRHPQAAGSYSVTVTATDSVKDQASATLTLKLDAAS